MNLELNMSRIMESLRINIMGDLTLPSLAQIIRSKGRGPDTILAHITPKEAEMLKANGGAGTINSETGLPEFYDDYYSEFDPKSYMAGASYEAPSYQAAPDFTARYSPSYESDYYTGGGYTPEGYTPQWTTGRPEPVQTYPVAASTIPQGMDWKYEPAASVAQPGDAAVPSVPQPVAPSQVVERVLQPQKQEPSFFDKLTENAKKYLTDPENLGKLGVAALGALGGAKAAKEAQQQGQQAKQEMQQIAQPYTKRAEELMGAAQRGELTPASAQSLEAARARLQQGIETRGGVGVQQAANQLAMLRNELLQNQYDYGLKLLGIGDNIAIGAIKSGLQADQYVNELTNKYYTNIARTIYGSATTQQGD